MTGHTAVVILNWNGKHHLERFLPLLIERTADAEIILADGASSDGSVLWAKQQYPQVRCIELEKNFGFAGGYNKALEQVDADIFVLLNSDVEVRAGWLEPLVDHLNASASHGACQPKVLSYSAPERFEHAGASGGFMDIYGFPFCRGRIFASFERDQAQYDSTAQVFWATGTCLAIKKKAWKEAGGFDADFFAHMEEIDLCWRVQRAGYQVHAVPASTILHVGGGTLPYKHPRKTLLNFRNSLVVLSKNAPGPIFFLIMKRLLLDAAAAWKFVLDGNPRHFFAVVQAHWTYFVWLPSTFRKRRELKRKFPTAWGFGVYRGSIAWAHFLKKKEKFSDIEF